MDRSDAGRRDFRPGRLSRKNHRRRQMRMAPDLRRVLGIEIPILSSPLGGASGPELVAAVSNAGGYGVIPLWGDPADKVRDGIRRTRELTNRNFAVNLNMSLDYREALQTCIEERVHAVSFFWGHDAGAIATAKEADLVVLSSVGSAAEARMAQEAGADIIVAQGYEAGGHVWGQVSTMALIPAVSDAVDVPILAAGGIADGRGMAAAMMLGAAGVWVGTRFLASHEAEMHETFRARVIAATETDTEWHAELYDGHWPKAPHRTLKNPTSEAWRDAGRPPPGDRPGENEVIGTRPGGAEILRYEC
ncbi:nitronate monooxygenase [Roseovarius sp. D22-M7]|uniref:nitronate monooxygenase n=1 Tax=Roseovarius sp. D22-M7 TaxID=3127116 RepID=UPI00300FCC93